MLALADQKIDDYAAAKTEPTSHVLEDLYKETYAKTAVPQMLSGPVQGRFLKLMVQATGARRVLEIGMFTGYSALSMAEGLPNDGELIAMEIDPEIIGIAQKFFKASEHGFKIKVMEGPALESLKKLDGIFDLVFIDADKVNYQNYYELVLPMVKEGGVILIDNVLWGGGVLDPKDAESRAIAALNDKIAGDNRVDRVLLPMRDGIFFVRKR